MNGHRVRIALFFVAAILVLGAAGAPLAAQEASDAGPTGEGPWVVSAHYADRQMVYELAAWLEPWEVHHDEGYLIVAVDRDQYERMVEAGFELEIDWRLTEELHRPFVALPGQRSGIPGFPCYRTVEETFASAENLVTTHPTLATWIDIGDSWDKTEPGDSGGYDLMVLRLTNSAVAGPKPKLFVMTSIHARELATAELNTRFAEYLVANYGLDPDVTWLLDHHEIHLLLVSNPDGRKMAEQGLLWRKNTNQNYCSPTSDYRGADLNRNFEFEWGDWGGSSGAECDETYRGPSAASEPETQSIQDYVRSQFPDQREDDLDAPAPDDAMGVFLDIHSYSELVLWPWGFTHSEAPNGTALQTLGRKFAYFNDYHPEQAIGLYPTDGTTDGLGYGELGLAAYCFELGTSFFQDCGTFESTILPDNLPALIYAAKVSRTPYLTPAGPDALAASVSKPAVELGETVRLAATLDDTRYNQTNGTEPVQPIAAAEYYVDVPPWVTTASPVAHPMVAVDGAFDQTVEEAEAWLAADDLGTGQHIVFVRGQDADGNWGPFSAVFVSVFQPNVLPIIEGYVLGAATSNPLAATVTANAFQADTNPTTGYYSMTVLSDTYEITAIAAGHAISTVTGVEAHNYQTVRQDFRLEPVCPVLVDDMESGTEKWSHGADAGTDLWTLSTPESHSPSHAWHNPGSGEVTDNSLWNSAPIVLGPDAYLSFWHHYEFESSRYHYDGAVIETSTDGGGTWVDLGPYITAGGYNGTISTCCGNPLGGRSAWVDEADTWTQVQADLSSFAGQSVYIRWRIGSDASVALTGWYVDDILVTTSGPACEPPYSVYLPLVSNER